MQPYEIVVARLGSGLSVVRAIDRQSLCKSTKSKKVRILTARNKEARLPHSRILLSTGVVARDSDTVEKFTAECEALSKNIDLSEIWEITRDQERGLTLKELNELYWNMELPVPVRQVALLFQLENPDIVYFFSEGEKYKARSKEDVENIWKRRSIASENARMEIELMNYLVTGNLPPNVTPYQEKLVLYIKRYVIDGENFARNNFVRKLVGLVNSETRDPQKFSFEILVKAKLLTDDEPLELARSEISTTFPEIVSTEVQSLNLTSILEDPRRVDLTSYPVTTIDDEGSIDKDDGLSLSVELSSKDGKTPVAYRLGIHIADAGAIVPPNSAIDHEAQIRMATLYLPERNIPMLPLEIGNDMGSLLPGVKRATLSLILECDENGEILDWELMPSVIMCQSSLSYKDAENAISDSADPKHFIINALFRLSQRLHQKRESEGGLTFNRPEMTIKVTKEGDVNVDVSVGSSKARDMVAEFMILYNSTLAEFCNNNGLPAIYRTQSLNETNRSEVNGSDLKKVSTDPLLRYLMMRRLPPAELNSAPHPHMGLGVSTYVQLTSPLRRYPDLVMQRQISYFLEKGKTLYSTEDMIQVMDRAKIQLKDLSRIEEERKRYWFLKYLNKSFLCPSNVESELIKAVVLEHQTGRSAILELENYPFRIRAMLPIIFTPGDIVNLKLMKIDLWRKSAHFVYVPETPDP